MNYSKKIIITVKNKINRLNKLLKLLKFKKKIVQNKIK